MYLRNTNTQSSRTTSLPLVTTLITTAERRRSMTAAKRGTANITASPALATGLGPRAASALVGRAHAVRAAGTAFVAFEAGALHDAIVAGGAVKEIDCARNGRSVVGRIVLIVRWQSSHSHVLCR